MNITYNYLPIIISSGFFLFIVLSIIGILIFIRYHKKKKILIGKIKKGGKETQTQDIESKSVDSDRLIQNKIVEILISLGQKVTSKEKALVDYSKTRPLFLKAGIRKQNAPAIFMGVKVALSVLLPVCLILLRLFAPNLIFSARKMIFLIVILAMIGFYLPNLWLRIKIIKRRDVILKGFPDALDLMLVCVEAGMGLDSAITRVSKELKMNNEVLSDELNLYNMEMRAGKLRKDALNNLAMRTDVQEVKNLVTVLIQTDQFGTSIGQALRVYSDTMRTERFQRAEEKAAKIPVKLLFPLILFIFPALFVVILGPAGITIVRALRGILW